jgi:hypothetical protein
MNDTMLCGLGVSAKEKVCAVKSGCIFGLDDNITLPFINTGILSERPHIKVLALHQLVFHFLLLLPASMSSFV